MTIKACVFDAYGTLFDVSAAARAAATEPGGAALATHWPALAESWRRKQLEYTWLRTIMGEYADFEVVTREALVWAMMQAGLGDTALRDRLMSLYHRLSAYPEVPAMLDALKAAGRTTAILSNGTPRMLSDAVAAAGIGDALDAVISVDPLGLYKPHAKVYALVTDHFGCAPHEVLFVSSNGWDAAGAAHAGCVTVWVNRRAEPVDRLPQTPAHVLSDLSGLPELLEEM